MTYFFENVVLPLVEAGVWYYAIYRMFNVWDKVFKGKEVEAVEPVPTQNNTNIIHTKKFKRDLPAILTIMLVLLPTSVFAEAARIKFVQEKDDKVITSHDTCTIINHTIYVPTHTPTPGKVYLAKQGEQYKLIGTYPNLNQRTSTLTQLKYKESTSRAQTAKAKAGACEFHVALQNREIVKKTGQLMNTCIGSDKQCMIVMDEYHAGSPVELLGAGGAPVIQNGKVVGVIDSIIALNKTRKALTVIPIVGIEN